MAPSRLDLLALTPQAIVWRGLVGDIVEVVTPGTGYGKYGEGYIRLSVTAADADVDEGLSRLSAWSRAQGARE